MITPFFQQRLKTISTEGLYLIYQDAVNRIGSHYIGGGPDVNYIKKQEAIISTIQEELNSRKMLKEK